MGNTNPNYYKVYANDHRMLGLSIEDMKRRSMGTALYGSEFQKSNTNINLSKYQVGRVPHLHKLAFWLGESWTCTFGTITMSAYLTLVTIILPDYCSYGFPR